jgi:hypothetical protein
VGTLRSRRGKVTSRIGDCPMSFQRRASSSAFDRTPATTTASQRSASRG